MNKFLITLIASVLLITLITVFAFTPTNNLQNIQSNHTIDRLGSSNNYQITTVIAGMQDADIALIKYSISDKYTYNASEKNAFFSDRDNNYIKFFIMEIPNEGNVMIHLGVTIDDPKSIKELEFPVELEFSSNGQKQTVKLPTIKLDETSVNSTDYIAEEKDSMIHTISTVDPKTMTTSTEILEEASELEDASVEEEALISATESDEDETSNNEEVSNTAISTGQYTVQLLALSEFSKSRVDQFCDLYDIPVSKVKIETIDGMTKVRYGLFDSEKEVKALHQQLLDKNVEGVFIVKLETD